jgi:hypothetical protein
MYLSLGRGLSRERTQESDGASHVASNPSAAPNYPVRITAINKVAETVTLQNVIERGTII